MRLLLKFLILLPLFACGSAFSQEVTDGGVLTTSDIRAANKLAVESPIRSWPTLGVDQTSGTQIEASGDFLDSDLTITTFKSYGLNRLLALAEDAARGAGLPNTRFIYLRGRRLISVDLEFNRYIRQNGNSSQSTMPLGILLNRIQNSDLPRPIGVYIRKPKSGSVTVDGQAMDHSEVLSPFQVSDSAQLTVQSTRSPLGLCAVIGVAAFLVLLPTALIVGLVKTAGREVKKAHGWESGTTITANQLAYERLKKSPLGKLLPLFPILVFGTSFCLRFAIEASGDWVSHDSMTRFFTLEIVLLVGAVLAMTWHQNKAGKRRRDQGAPSEEVPSRNVLLLLPLLTVPMLVLILITRSTAFLFVPNGVIRFLGFAVPISTLAAVIVFATRLSRGTRVKLKAGDPDFDFATALAASNGVKLRSFYETLGKKPNALATLGSSIRMTKGAREQLTAEERQAVIAHEIGHLKFRHVNVLFAAVLVFNSAYVGALIYSETRLQALNPNLARYLFASPVAFNLVFLLLFQVASSPFRKRWEHQADLFALRQIGDYALVARSLAKIHLLGGAPHTYIGFDALAGTHPSLMKRLSSLRESATELGMAVNDEELREFFDQEDQTWRIGQTNSASQAPAGLTRT